MKFDNIPPIKGNPVIAKEIRSAAGQPGRKMKGQKRYKVSFICNKREELTGLANYYGTSRAAVLNQLIAKDSKRVLR